MRLFIIIFLQLSSDLEINVNINSSSKVRNSLEEGTRPGDVAEIICDHRSCSNCTGNDRVALVLLDVKYDYPNVNSIKSGPPVRYTQAVNAGGKRRLTIVDSRNRRYKSLIGEPHLPYESRNRVRCTS